ncbi:hypothetical protein G9P44_004160 [Scheffersomyces stipitis]|nr:hypothetical protein G9P44_004160 [Scheffersomyces stipitis]
MGSNTSKEVKTTTEETFNEKVSYSSSSSQYDSYSHLLSRMDVSREDVEAKEDEDNGDGNGIWPGISVGLLDGWKGDVLRDDKNKLVQNSLAINPIQSIIAKSDVETVLKDQYFFNVTVKTIGSPSYFNNQKSSGRCWIFAASNVFRTSVIKNYNLKDDSFQLSQAYLFFYDKLEKSHFFLDNIADTADHDLDSRLVQYLLSSPVGDGGQWDMIVNLVEKYGLVPHQVFPDNAQASNSSPLNYLVTEKLREAALIIRRLYQEKAPQPVIEILKGATVYTVFKILSLALGSPPNADEPFTWEYIDKDGKYKSYQTNPRDFYRDHVRLDAAKHFSLIHDPRNDYDKLYTVDRLNNILGGKKIEYVNTEIDEIKSVAIKMLKDDEPIFFGSDVGKFGDRSSGVLDVTAYDYKLAFNISLGLDKAERLRTGSSQMTHAMVITGVHLDPVTQLPVRWKIENSWGDAVGDKGYFVMSDEWFSEYVFQIVTNKKYASKKTYDTWKGKDFTVLPYYDPMGSLA